MDKMLVAEAESLAELAAAAEAAGADKAAALIAAGDDEEDESAFDKPGFVKVGAAHTRMPNTRHTALPVLVPAWLPAPEGPSVRYLAGCLRLHGRAQHRCLAQSRHHLVLPFRPCR